MSELIETCVMCGADLSGIGVRRGFTAALIFGNMSRDPHVGPYCENCGPPHKVPTTRCVKDCPKTGERWTPYSECEKCDFFLGWSPLQFSCLSCTHPGWKGKCVLGE